MHVRAHAKINLALAVGPPVPPKGYHPIASLFCCIDLADDLTLKRLPDSAPSSYSITWSGGGDAPRPSPIDWPVEKDLAVRAHRLLEQHVDRALPVRVALSKRIPVGAGLGGGSSDAAAMLLALNRLFDLGVAAPRLAELGAQLGADVSFFLDPTSEIRNPTSDIPPRPALVFGFGERIERLPSPPPLSLLLLLPPFGCPTGPVYQAFDKLLSPRHALRESAVRAVASSFSSNSLDPSSLFNDLAPAAESVAPALADLRRRASEVTGRPVHITGSGSAMFIIADASADLAARLAAAVPELVILPSRLV